MTIEEFQARAELLASQMQTEVVEAERQFEMRINAPLPPKKYANTQYWDKVGPMIDGYRWSQRYDKEEKALQQVTDAIAAKYYQLLLKLESEL